MALWWWVQNLRVAPALKNFAESHGLDYPRKGPGAHSETRRYRDHAIAIRTHPSVERNTTEYGVVLPGELPMPIAFWSTDSTLHAHRTRDRETVEVGDDDFDRRFFVESDDPAGGRALLAREEVVERLVRLDDNHIEVEFRSGKLELVESLHPTNSAAVEETVRTMTPVSENLQSDSV